MSVVALSVGFSRSAVRMAKFTMDRAREWLAAELITRLQALSSDIASLVQFAEALVSRVQLL